MSNDVGISSKDFQVFEEILIRANWRQLGALSSLVSQEIDKREKVNNYD